MSNLKQSHWQPRRRYGQHFLRDKDIIRRIVQAIVQANVQANVQASDANAATPIVEIGPGRGALTWPLLAQTRQLDVVEIDRDLADRLRQDQPCTDKCTGRLTVHQADALVFDFTRLYKEKIKIVGNLPYKISTPLLFHLLAQLSAIEEMVFMLQKELVDRLCARPNCKDYGRLTVMLQSQCQVSRLFKVPPAAFTPPPQVDSALIRLRPDPQTAAEIAAPECFAEIVKSAFSYRRKTLRNALAKRVREEHFAQAGIAPSARAENLSVKDFIVLANSVHSHESGV